VSMSAAARRMAKARGLRRAWTCGMKVGALEVRLALLVMLAVWMPLPVMNRVMIGSWGCGVEALRERWMGSVNVMLCLLE